jgi:ABC-2 type transport system ATP-binding protein
MSSHILTEVDRLATRIGIIHQGKLIEELDADTLEKLRSKRLEIKTRDLQAAQNCIRSSGYRFTLEDGSIFIEDDQAIDHPDDIASMMVQAGVAPMKLVVEQQNLEDHFLQLTGGAQ